MSQLKPNRRLGREIINVVLFSLTREPSPSTTYLGTEIYEELKTAQFGNTKSWTEGLARDKQWSLAIYEDHHWMAVLIDWKLRKFFYYDPQHLSKITGQHHKTVITVSDIGDLHLY
jgi:hypothetical protein